MALHKTGFPKEEATSRKAYLITAGSDPTQVVCSAWAADPILFLHWAHPVCPLTSIYNSNTCCAIRPPAGIENAFKNRVITCSLYKECGKWCVQTRIPCWFSKLLPYHLLTQSVLKLESLACGCNGSVLPKLLVFTSVVHAWTLTHRVVNI